MVSKPVLAWWRRPVRMMRLDYGPDLQRMKEADLAALAHSKKHEWHINCEWVIATPGIAPGLGHLVTFETPHFEHYPGLDGWDLIRSYLPHAKREGIHVLAYTNMHWFSHDFGRAHRDWEQLMADGRPYGEVHPLYGSGTTFCVNSGWRDWGFALIEEIAKTGLDGIFLDGPVIYPRCCYCQRCRALFQERYGEEPPTVEDWSSELWKTFIDFREDSMADFLRDAREHLRSINPDGVIFLNAGSWHSGSWRVARNIERLGEFQEFNGAELFFHPGPGANAPIPWAITAKHLMAGGKPAVVFSHHTLGPWHYIPLPPLEAKMAVAETVACGANPWFAVFDYALDHSRAEAVAPMNEIMGFLSDNEPYYTATESAAEVAVFYSRQSATFYASNVEDLYQDRGTGREQHLVADVGTGRTVVDWKQRKQMSDALYGNEFAGWCVALSRQHIPFDVLLDSIFTAEVLSRYQVVVLPNAACLSAAQIEAVEAYVASGGRLVATFETGRYDERGVARPGGSLDHLLGIEPVQGAFAPSVSEEYVQVVSAADTAPYSPGRLLPRPLYALQVRAEDGREIPVRFLEPTGKTYAAIKELSPFAAEVRGETAHGRVVFFPHALGDNYYRYRIAEHEQWMAAAVRWAFEKQPLVEVAGPPTLQTEVRRQDGRLLVHLVNHTGDTQRPMTFLVPVTGVSVVVRGEKARRAHLLRSGVDIQASPAGSGAWSYEIPSVAEYDVLVLE
jgi:hypothetical protein